MVFQDLPNGRVHVLLDALETRAGESNSTQAIAEYRIHTSGPQFQLLTCCQAS